MSRRTDYRRATRELALDELPEELCAAVLADGAATASALRGALHLART